MCTCGSRPGVIPGGNSSVMHSGSVRYTSFRRGQPPISAGRINGASVVMAEDSARQRAGRRAADLYGDTAHDRGAIAAFGPPEARAAGREVENELVRLVVQLVEREHREVGDRARCHGATIAEPELRRLPSGELVNRVLEGEV